MHAVDAAQRVKQLPGVFVQRPSSWHATCLIVAKQLVVVQYCVC
jgi:hypothetical protein